MVSFKQCITWLPLNRISQHKEEALLYSLLSSKLYKPAANNRVGKVSEEGLQIAFLIKDIQQVHHRSYGCPSSNSRTHTRGVMVKI